MRHITERKNQRGVRSYRVVISNDGSGKGIREKGIIEKCSREGETRALLEGSGRRCIPGRRYIESKTPEANVPLFLWEKCEDVDWSGVE